jgi:ornithine cyclodeaminase
MFVVSARELRKLVSMADAITALEDGFRLVVDGTGEQPARLSFSDGSGLAMMARGSTTGTNDGVVFKLVSIRKSNQAPARPALHAIVLWFDGETGEPAMIVEGASLTALRTGAASGLATRLLAAEDAATLAVIGAGGQAADQVRGVVAVRPIRRVRVFSPSRTSAERLAGALGKELPAIDFEVSASASAAVDRAEVVCCATSSATPVVQVDWFGERVHVNAIGAYRPDMCELPEEVLTRATIVAVDSLEAATSESGEIMSALASGGLDRAALRELGEFVVAPPPASSGLTVFKSVGIALQDWAVGRLLRERVDGSIQTIQI